MTTTKKINDDYSGVWEQLHNPDFKSIEFDGLRQQ